MCDASAAVPLDGGSVVVADDEENVLRVYDADRGGAPLVSVELSAILGLPTKVKKDGSTTSKELDLEAAARIGTEAYFLTSHGRDSRGRERPERLKFFALRPSDSEHWALHGAVYEGLLDDLLEEPRLAPYGLADAAQLAPKSPGGLNIEGMSPRAEGGAWLGFRNPLPEGRALVMPFLNPEAVVLGARAAFGDPQLLDLGGRGVRALARFKSGYLIAAGAFDSSPGGVLFSWDGGSTVTELRTPSLLAYNPEALLVIEGRSDVLLMSDDGSLLIEGAECKKLKDRTKKRFRGLWLQP